MPWTEDVIFGGMPRKPPRTSASMSILVLAAAAFVAMPAPAASWLAVPALFSAPETGFGGGLKIRVRDLAGPSSRIDFLAIGTVKKQVHVETEFWRDSIAGLWRAGTLVEAGLFPEPWYGRGNPGRPEDEAIYTPRYLKFALGGGRHLGGGWIAGLECRTSLWDIRSPDSGALAWPTSGRDGGVYHRLRTSLEHEGRDNPDNPGSGTYLSLAGTLPLPFSDISWSEVEIDASAALGLVDGRLLAVGRLRHREAFGAIPFHETPFLGNRKNLRGVPNKRLRGQAVQAAGAELRLPLRILRWSTQGVLLGELGRAGSGTTVWTADIIPTAGAGGRLLLDGGRAVLRVDYAFSRLSTGGELYVDFGHAF